jgi:hypothetical protein
MVEKAEAKAWDNDGEMAARDQKWTAWAADKISGARQCWPQFSRRGMIVFTCHLPGRADDTPGHPTGGRWPWPLTCDGGQGSIERWQADCSPVALDANGGSEADAMRRAVLTAP